jgi:TetR/AcrR family transcriptional regulator, transcriptional repressor for nem operon
VKVTKQKAAENRGRLVRAAGKLFRQHGIDGIGVADIGKAAGLTHGAVYARFPSKMALAAEALSDGTKRTTELMKSACAAQPTIGAYLDFSLNNIHRDDIAGGCPLTASGSEIARQKKPVSRAFAEGFENYVAAVQEVLADNADYATARERAIAIAAAEIGTLIVSRAVMKADPAYSNEILAAGRRVLGEVGGECRQTAH